MTAVWFATGSNGIMPDVVVRMVDRSLVTLTVNGRWVGAIVKDPRVKLGYRDRFKPTFDTGLLWGFAPQGTFTLEQSVFQVVTAAQVRSIQLDKLGVTVGGGRDGTD